jgi:hypothetical protein
MTANTQRLQVLDPMVVPVAIDVMHVKLSTRGHTPTLFALWLPELLGHIVLSTEGLASDTNAAQDRTRQGAIFSRLESRHILQRRPVAMSI